MPCRWIEPRGRAGKLGSPWFRGIGLVSLGFLGLAGCGARPAVLPAVPAQPLVARLGDPRPLVPHPITGQAVSVLQRGHAFWLAMKTPHGIVVTRTQGQRRAQFTLPSAAACSAAGVLQGGASALLVTGCTHVWILHHHQWAPAKLPSLLGGPQDFTLDGSGWWLLGFGAGASGGEAVTLWRSSNAGGAWARVAASGNGLTSAPPHSLPYYGDKTGIAVSPAQQVWLTGITAGEGMAWLYRSGPGGRTWTPVSLGVPKAWTRAELASYPPVWASAHQGYLPVTVDGPTFTGIAVYTVNGLHTTWTSASSIPAPSLLTARFSLAVATPRSVWVATGRNLWASTDGGYDWRATWRLPPDWTFAGVSFSGRQDGVLLAMRRHGTTFDYAVWQTSNEGKTWTHRG